MVFQPQNIKAFHFINWEFEEKTATVKLNYAFDESIFFTETYTFTGAQTPQDQERKNALNKCLDHLHLVAGVSYYKAAVPPKICSQVPISHQAGNFFTKLYLHGLGEFAYQNKLDLRGKIHFPSSTDAESASSLKLMRKTIVPIGGGKDSVVSVEILRHQKEPIQLFSVGNPKVISDVVKIAGLPHIVVKRKICPNLLQLNKEGALNGHVPISAIIAFVLATAAVLYDFDIVTMSNERSANVGNLWQQDLEINHQYSKSFEFEKDVGEFFQSYVLKNFYYFSLLRPLSELTITKIFSRAYSYHDKFTSCNSAFRLDETRRSSRWCLNCPKCRFVFLALAPFLNKSKLLHIFSSNLLAEKSQTKGFDALLGVESHKPFECVGEVEESTAAFIILSRQKDWQEDYLVKRFSLQILPKIKQPEEYIEKALAISENHRIPPQYEELLRAACKVSE